MFELDLAGVRISMGLIVVDMQNGFVAKGGSYDKLGMNTPAYREASGVDLLTKVHILLPKSREERMKIPICVRGTWDAQTIDELKPKEEDHLIIKRRDSAFLDTELRMWLQSFGINVVVFCGVDTSICV